MNFVALRSVYLTFYCIDISSLIIHNVVCKVPVISYVDINKNNTDIDAILENYYIDKT